MSEYELLKGLSEVDEELIMQPRKYISLRMNFLLCIIAANISRIIPHSKQELSIIIFLIFFWVQYGVVTWFINRKKKRRLLIERDEE